MLESGESIQAIQVSMGRKSAAATRKYLKRLKHNGKPVRHSRRRMIRKKDEMPARKPGRAQPGNQLNLWHGYYARNPLPEMVWLLQSGKYQDETDIAIIGFRFVLRRLAFLRRDVKSLEEMMILLNVATMAAKKISLLIYRRWRMRTGYQWGGGIVRRRYRP